MELITSSTSLTNKPTVVGVPDPAPEDRQLLDQLVELWRSHQERDLQVRWETGALLNAHLGPPTKRLPHGGQVLKKAAERLQIAESDLSRMRWFAYRFESLEDFRAKHPQKHSWTKVKELLAALNAARKGEQSSDAGGNGEKSPGGQGGAAVGGILRGLRTATKRFRQMDFDLNDAKRERLREAIQQLVEAVSDRLQIRLKIETLEDA